LSRAPRKSVAKQPWHPAAYEDQDIYAVQAWAAGKASEGQQKRAFEWVMFNLCGIREMSFDPDSSRVTDFAEGKRWVGLQIGKLLKLVPVKNPNA
jgi:hypothetical protein